MNAIQALSFSLLRPNGQSLITRSNPDPEISIVRLVKSVIVPSLKGSFVRVKTDKVHALPGGSVLFEPSNGQLEPKGLYSQESLITIDDDGCMLVPMVNVHGASTQLLEGMNIGCVQPLDEVPVFEPEDVNTTCASVDSHTVIKTPERIRRS